MDIASEFSICGEAPDGKEAVEKVLTLHPDLLLMDISMLVLNGIEATKRIRLLSPGTKIVMLSMHDSPQIVAQAQQAGSDGFSVKSRSWDDLQKTILKLLAERSGPC